MKNLLPKTLRRPFLNVHDIALVRYADFSGLSKRGLFYIIYTEGLDPASYRDERNFTCLKVSSNSQDRHSVTLKPDRDNKLRHVSYVNCNKLMTFRVDQVVSVVGTVKGSQRANTIKHVSAYLGTILKHIGVDLNAY